MGLFRERACTRGSAPGATGVLLPIWLWVARAVGPTRASPDRGGATAADAAATVAAGTAVPARARLLVLPWAPACHPSDLAHRPTLIVPTTFSARTTADASAFLTPSPALPLPHAATAAVRPPVSSWLPACRLSGAPGGESTPSVGGLGGGGEGARRGGRGAPRHPDVRVWGVNRRHAVAAVSVVTARVGAGVPVAGTGGAAAAVLYGPPRLRLSGGCRRWPTWAPQPAHRVAAAAQSGGRHPRRGPAAVGASQRVAPGSQGRRRWLGCQSPVAGE